MIRPPQPNLVRRLLRRLARRAAAPLVKRLTPADPLALVRRNTLTVRSLADLMQALQWTLPPMLDLGPLTAHLHRVEHPTDLNQRRLRDAQVLLAAARNARHHGPNSGSPPEDHQRQFVEVGTSTGQTTALLARNAPDATIHTVNIPPHDIDRGGRFVTYAPGTDLIGRCYRDAGCTNVRQILANTADWRPDADPLLTAAPLDLAFIDGCHDADFVFNDTAKLLPRCAPGSVLLWHDFNPSLAANFPWIADVGRGVELLYRHRLIHGRILHLQDSWVGLYVVAAADLAQARSSPATPAWAAAPIRRIA